MLYHINFKKGEKLSDEDPGTPESSISEEEQTKAMAILDLRKSKGMTLEELLMTVTEQTNKFKEYKIYNDTSGLVIVGMLK